MKKITMIIAAVSVCLTLASCAEAPKNHDEESRGFEDIELVRVHCDRAGYENLSKLEADSDLIVVGEFVGDAAQNVDYDYDVNFDKDIVVNVMSTGTLRISKVLKGNIEEGADVDVYQRCGIVDGRLITFSGLTPMQNGDEWLFFLKKGTGVDGYWCSSDTFGRYPVPNAENALMPLSDSPDLGVYNEEDFNGDIYDEIVEKYGI